MSVAKRRCRVLHTAHVVSGHVHIADMACLLDSRADYVALMPPALLVDVQTVVTVCL